VFMKKYLSKPIHLFGTIGLLTFGAGAIIDIVLLIQKLMGQDLWGRPLLLLGTLLTLGGLQFITVGIITELQMRTYYESQNKRPYRIKNHYVGAEKVEVSR